MPNNSNEVAFEKLLTLSEAAEAMGCHHWQIRRAVNSGRMPSYAPFNSRRLVKLSEVIAFIDACRTGGSD